MAVASVSCIYGLTAREDYEEMCIPLNVGMTLDRDDLLRKLVEVQFERNDTLNQLALRFKHPVCARGILGRLG